MKIFVLSILSVLLLLISSCSSISYYLDAANGHLSILADQEAIKDILDKKDIDPVLQSKLILATRARDFASSEMQLPNNDSYRYYSDIKRPYVVWNVIATEQYSVKAKQWCFLVVGCVSYRGYFNKKDAEEYADSLASQGFDVNVAGAQAYSTLGWFDDPLLNTMIQHSEGRLVGLIIHELAHQQIYIDNDTSFNEAFATSVEAEGIKRWFEQSTTAEPKLQQKLYQKYKITRKREIQFKQLLKTTQIQLEALFESSRFKNSKTKDKLKKAVFSQLQQNYKNLKSSWQQYSGYDAWMSRELNNAHLALVATYNDRVPAFQSILKSVNGDVVKYYKRVAVLGELPKEQRDRRLDDYHKQYSVNSEQN